MIVEPDYKGFWILVEAVPARGRWNADVRIRRMFAEEKPHVEQVTCYKLTPAIAERVAAMWARRWIDIKEER